MKTKSKYINIIIALTLMIILSIFLISKNLKAKQKTNEVSKTFKTHTFEKLENIDENQIENQITNIVLYSFNIRPPAFGEDSKLVYQDGDFKSSDDIDKSDLRAGLIAIVSSDDYIFKEEVEKDKATHSDSAVSEEIIRKAAKLYFDIDDFEAFNEEKGDDISNRTYNIMEVPRKHFTKNELDAILIEDKNATIQISYNIKTMQINAKTSDEKKHIVKYYFELYEDDNKITIPRFLNSKIVDSEVDWDISKEDFIEQRMEFAKRVAEDHDVYMYPNNIPEDTVIIEPFSKEDSYILNQKMRIFIMYTGFRTPDIIDDKVSYKNPYFDKIENADVNILIFNLMAELAGEARDYYGQAKEGVWNERGYYKFTDEIIIREAKKRFGIENILEDKDIKENYKDKNKRYIALDMCGPAVQMDMSQPTLNEDGTITYTITYYDNPNMYQEEALDDENKLILQVIKMTFMPRKDDDSDLPYLEFIGSELVENNVNWDVTKEDLEADNRAWLIEK